MPPPPALRVVLYNPLPKAMSHYATAFRSAIEGEGLAVDTVAVDLEPGRASLPAKFWTLLRSLPRMARIARTKATVVVLWPAFGSIDLVWWWLLAPRGARRIVIIHDPVPLRRQVGHSALGHRLARRASRAAALEIVAHTAGAARALEDQGVAVSAVLPHPVLPRRSSTGPQGHQVRLTVLGQYKPARDLVVLEQIAAAAPPDWLLQIAGRGWPPVQGWEVEDTFLSEEELDRKMTASTAVLIPYRYYFQSGIATRSFELGVPVVARRHEFVESLYGSSWPGLVDGDGEAWVDAVRRVESATRPDAECAAASAGGLWRRAIVLDNEGVPA